MKTKIIVLQGLPASGKSTWAREFVKGKKDWVIVSRDSIRESRGDYWIPEQEDYITEVENGSITSALAAKLNVIIDATNFNPAVIDRFKNYAEITNSDFEIKVFNISLSEAIIRDKCRARSVGEKVIRRFHKKYLSNTPKIKAVQNESLKPAYIVDIDGTLALMEGRTPYELDKVINDLPNQNVIDIITNLSKNHDIIIVSGREDVCYAETKAWLLKHSIPHNQLFMRKSRDNRKDSIIKNEIYNDEIRNKYYIKGVFDDRDSVVKMWRSLGLTCCQVDYGDF